MDFMRSPTELASWCLSCHAVCVCVCGPAADLVALEPRQPHGARRSRNTQVSCRTLRRRQRTANGLVLKMTGRHFKREHFPKEEQMIKHEHFQLGLALLFHSKTSQVLTQKRRQNIYKKKKNFCCQPLNKTGYMKILKG